MPLSLEWQFTLRAYRLVRVRPVLPKQATPNSPFLQASSSPSVSLPHSTQQKALARCGQPCNLGLPVSRISLFINYPNSTHSVTANRNQSEPGSYWLSAGVLLFYFSFHCIFLFKRKRGRHLEQRLLALQHTVDKIFFFPKNSAAAAEENSQRHDGWSLAGCHGEAGKNCCGGELKEVTKEGAREIR